MMAKSRASDEIWSQSASSSTSGSHQTNDTAQLQSQLAATQASLSARFQELATLTKLLKEAEDTCSAALDQRDWLAQVLIAISDRRWWWGFMPPIWQSRKLQARLRRRKLFDGDRYLELYPDVVEADIDPLRHYVMHGMGEGRTCPTGG